MPKTTDKSIKNSFDTLITSDQLQKIESIFKKATTSDEFEIMFFNYKPDFRMGYENFLRVLEYLTYKSKKNSLKLENTTVLDISYTTSDGKILYRVTVNGLVNINKYMEMLHQRNNHVIFSVLVGQYGKDPAITLVKKNRNSDDVVDVDDFMVRVRLCKESDMDKNEINMLKSLDETTRDNIRFRYKQRVSIINEDSKELTFKTELTTVKMSNNISRLDKTAPIYELEIDVTPKSKSIASKYLETIFTDVTTLLKILQQSNYIIVKSQEAEVLNVYCNLIGVKREDITSLVVRKPQSLEIQHVIDKLPNKYAVTDKADGERYCLIIVNNNVYLISDNLAVKNTGIMLPENKSQYNSTILDGEYLFITEHNRYVYMAFDCLFKGTEDIRKISLFLDRLKNVDDVIRNCFTFKNQKGFNFIDYSGKFEMNKLMQFYNKQIDDFMDALNHDIATEKQYSLIRRKLFIPATGIQNNEIYKYSELIWQKYIYDKRTNCPYTLDGEMFHPLDQKYVTSVKESKFVEYKWKPAEKNSIDFYIQFEKSSETGKVLILYDNSRDDLIKGKAYKIAHLYVGRTTRGGEQPVLFQQDTDKYIAYLFLRDGEVRDSEGKILQDNTVVEFYYNNDPNIPEKHRWVPIKTRQDKTELVQKYRIKYGNYGEVANKIWRSIQNPVLMKDFTILAKDDMVDKHIDTLRNRIAHSVIMSEQQENEYYQKTTNLALPMRNFHNWIKSIIIYTHCNPIYEEGKQLSILDIGCGRGGDIMKFYYAKVDFYVGVDLNNPNLISPVNGAISRYNRLRRTHPNFPRMFFINADVGTLLDYDEQAKVIGNMSKQNKDLITRFFSLNKDRRTLFDRINCQFAIHYMMPNMIVWNNFIENINMYLKSDGYLLVSTFDADEVLTALGDKDKFTSYYTNSNGEQEVLFEIIKKFDKIDNKKVIGPGYAIDVYNALILQEDNYITEYLVQKEFLETQFKERCGLTLVETDLFGNQYNIHEDYFKKVAVYEENVKTKKFLMNAAEYYNQKEEVNKASYQMTKLNRYYVFRRDGANVNSATKVSKSSKQKATAKQQTGGLIVERPLVKEHELNIFEIYGNPGEFVKRDINSIKEYSFMGAVHDILKTQDIIPQSLPMLEFYKDLKYNTINDNELTDGNICKLCENLVVGHDYSASEKSVDTALNGPNIFVIESGCGDVNVTTFGSSKKNKVNLKKPTMILYKEDGIYYPVYRYKDSKHTGLFDSKQTFIKKILKDSAKVKTS